MNSSLKCVVSKLQSDNKRIRSSNIELMRIICILMIIGGHYYTHNIHYDSAPLMNDIFLKIFGGFSKLSVNTFVLITGYFGANLTTKRVLPLIKDRWFYSMLVSSVLVALGAVSVTPRFLLQTALPLTMCKHNYITTFVVLYFFVPYINVLLEKLSKKQFLTLLVYETIFFSLIPTVIKDFSVDMYSYILWMVFLYQIGYYLYWYKPTVPWKIVMPASFVLLWVCTIFVEPIAHIDEKMYFANKQNSIVLLFASVGWFGFFANLKMKSSSFINWLSSSTFAVYIIHDDPYMREFLWNKVFLSDPNSNYMIIHFFVSIIIIYLSCIAIDKVYRLTLSNLLQKLWDIIISTAENVFKKVFDRISNIF